MHGSPAAHESMARNAATAPNELYPSVSADVVLRPPENAATETIKAPGTGPAPTYCTIYARCCVRFGRVAEVRTRCRRIIGSGLDAWLVWSTGIEGVGGWIPPSLIRSVARAASTVLRAQLPFIVRRRKATQI
jgi:hypothetical protein